jgi:hypothetical protein
MNKLERIYYFSIIVAEVIIIVILGIRLSSLKKHKIEKMHDRPILSTKGVNFLYSFKGENTMGEEELIHFTAYSNKFYIFVKFSSGCHHCDEFIDEFMSFFVNRNIDKDINLVLLTEEPVNEFNDIPKIKWLRLSFDDIFQFGTEVPAIIAANGTGEILLKRVGYYEGIFEGFLEAIKNNKYKKSKIIEQ